MLSVNDRIENGMLVGAAAYDLQQQRPPMARCSVCGKYIPAVDTREILSSTVCEDCEEGFLEGYVKDFAQNYATSEPDFFVKYWLESLEPEDRQAILEQAYWRFRVSPESHRFAVQLEREFARDNITDFIEFLEED